MAETDWEKYEQDAQVRFLRSFHAVKVEGGDALAVAAESAAHWNRMYRELADTDARESLTRATAAAPLDAWMPIETAPKDGRDVLLSEGRSVWIDEWILNGPDSCWLMCDQWEEPVEPTLWMPVPTAPNATTPTQPETPSRLSQAVAKARDGGSVEAGIHFLNEQSKRMTAPEPPDPAAEAELRLRAVACAARDFIWEPENWEAWQDAKESNSVAWPPEFLMLAQAVEKKYGPMPIDDDDKEPTNET